MINYSIINKSQLEGATRLDSEYYQTEYLELKNKINLLENHKFSEAAYIKSGTTPDDRDDTLDNGAVLLKTTDIRDVPLSKFSKYYHISKTINDRMKQTQLTRNDILVNIVGASLGVIGRSSIVPADFPEANITQAMALIRVRHQSYLPEYFYIFLLSKYGRSQLNRTARPTSQYNINLKEMGSLLVPRLPLYFQGNIKQIVDNSIDFQNKSRSSYLEAEQILNKSLGLDNFNIKNDLFSIVNLSDATSANRLDAEYFACKYERLLNHLKKCRVEKFENLYTITRGKNINYREGSEIGVIKTKQLGKQFIEYQTESETTREIVLDDNLPLVQDRDVIFASMGAGSLGKTNIFYDFENIKQKEFTIDSTLKIYRPKNDEVLPEVLAIYLSSPIGQELIYKHIVGSSGIISIYEDSIKNLSVPILSLETQQKIADLVRRSHEARKKSAQLLEEAKRKVEELIEFS